MTPLMSNSQADWDCPWNPASRNPRGKFCLRWSSCYFLLRHHFPNTKCCEYTGNPLPTGSSLAAGGILGSHKEYKEKKSHLKNAFSNEHDLIVLRSLDISRLDFPFPERESGRHILAPHSISCTHRHIPLTGEFAWSSSFNLNFWLFFLVVLGTPPFVNFAPHIGPLKPFPKILKCNPEADAVVGHQDESGLDYCPRTEIFKMFFLVQIKQLSPKRDLALC